MVFIRDLYYCEICKNLVEILQEGEPALVCCGQPMKKLIPKKKDEGLEKHVPVVDMTEKGVKVTVGSVMHPMEEEHHIVFIEVLTADKVYRKEFEPGDTPEAEFPVRVTEINEVREFCNVHGLWEK